MTDPAIETPGDGVADEARDPRSEAVHLLARAMWRERLALPTERAEGEEKPGRDDWKEKRRDYVKAAARLFKRLDRHGATLSAPAAPVDEGSEPA